MHKEIPAIEEQWELDMLNAGIARYNESLATAAQRQQHSSTKYGNAMLSKFSGEFGEFIKQDLINRSSKRGNSNIVVKELHERLSDIVDHHELAFITLKCVINVLYLPEKKRKAGALSIRIAKRVQYHLMLRQFQKTNGKYLKRIETDLKNRGVTDKERQRKILLHCFNKSATERWKNWSPEELLYIGFYLVKVLELFQQDIGMQIFKIVRAKATKQNQRPYILNPSTESLDWIEEFNKRAEVMLPYTLPTLVKPLDWKSPWYGGYHLPSMRKSRKLVKKPSVRQNNLLRKQHKAGKLQPVYDAINALQGTAWEINKYMLAFVEENWKRDFPLGLPQQEKYELPVCPITTRPYAKEFKTNKEYRKAVKEWQNDCKEEALMFEAWKKDRVNVYKKEAHRVGKLIQTSQTIALAKKLSQHDEFYHVYDIDTRGRVYTACALLSPQGDTLNKALLRFKNGTKIKDENGVRNMYIYAANLFGKDKIELDKRVQWVYDNKNMLERCVADPFENIDWLDADKPFVFLAVAEEITRFWKVKNNWRDFETHIPIMVDGSCNGNQHYSAILRDLVGANATNMMPGVIPSDLYNEVAFEVLKLLRETPADPLRELWVDNIGISRDLTKKPVMTLPYGGTIRGNREAVEDYLRSWVSAREQEFARLGKKFDNPIDKIPGGIYTAANYINSLIWEALGNSATSARKAMKFLKKITHAITNSPMQKKNNFGKKEGIPLTYIVRATGFPVDSTRMQNETAEINTLIDGRCRLSLVKETNVVNRRATSQAVPPNFIHSYDSAHLMLTVNAAHKAGIKNLAVVHDSYGCPAGQMELLHENIRSEFYNLYSNTDPILDLIEDNRNNLSEYTYNKLLKEYAIECKHGDYKLENVLKSDFFYR